MAEAKWKEPAAYKSQYGTQINNLTNAIVNREAFSYDPNTDPSYKAYAKEYGRLGDRARVNTLGDYAANTGGYASSYAVSAAQQAQNDYNQQLSMMIPQLMQAAYDRYQGDYNMNLGALNALTSRDDSLYGRWSDNRDYKRGVYESDRDYNFGVKQFNTQNSQWAKEYALDKRGTELDEKKFAWQKQQGSSGSGGGSGRSGGGRSGGSSSSSSSSNTYVDGNGNEYTYKDGYYYDGNGNKYEVDSNGELVRVDDKVDKSILAPLARTVLTNNVNMRDAGTITALAGLAAKKK